MNRYGDFNTEGTEFIITDPKTPRAYDNFLFNNSIFSYVQQTGVGYNKYQIGGSETTSFFNVRRDVMYDRDSLMNRLGYIRDNDTGDFWNINWEPVKADYDFYRCIHGIGYTVVESSVREIESRFRIFVPSGDDPVELWTIGLKNAGTATRNISVFLYSEVSFHFEWGFDAYGDLIYKHSYFDKDLNTLITEKHPENKPHTYLTGFLSADVPADGWDGSKEKFIGRYNKLNEPLRVIEGKCSNTPGTNEFTAAVLQFDMVLEPDKETNINLIAGVTDSVDSIAGLRNKYLLNTDQYFYELKEEKTAMFRSHCVHTPDEHLNRLINIWSKQQTLFGSVWTRWGMRGYRDIVQHALGITAFRPDITRSVLLTALRFQYRHGMALRGWDPVDTKAYSDSALWLVFTLTNYLKDTGDFSFIEQNIPYFDSGAGNVLEHIETALDYLEENKGIHGLCLIKFGDWNDSLTAIGKAGKGESVWLSMAYAAALLQLEELYSFLQKPEKAADCRRRYAEMKEAVNTHAWEGDRYIGCYSDSYRKIYSKESREGRIYINTQSWGIISGAADSEKTAAMLKAIDSELLTGYGYLLSAPTFFDFDPEIGRITAMEPGIAENGTVYSHGNAFMLWAFLQLGMADRAYDLFKRISPGCYSKETPTKTESPSYVFTNCYYGPDHRHSPYRMEYSWITGSVAWFYHLMTEWLPGIRKSYDGFRIEPALPSEWDQIEVEKTFREKRFKISIQRKGETAAGGTEIKLNGRELSENFIRFDESLEPTNTVELRI